MDGEMRPETLAEKRERGEDPLVVDIRNPPAFERGHIPDSVNIPLSRLPREVDRVADEDHVVTVCPHGKASVKAARLITSFEGFDGRVESLETGLSGWDGPIESASDGASGRPTREDEDQPEAPF